jgi:PDZ domain-containing secreted protein
MLTDEQLEEIKLKIETDKIRPIKAITILHPEGNIKDIREQLFSKYDREELRSHFKEQQNEVQTVEYTKEEKLSQVNKQLERMERRKERLLKEKADLEK